MQMIAGLRIEVATGMRHSRGSLVKLSQRVYGTTSKTKKGTLEELENIFEQRTGRRYGDSD
jgi:hypothetical protein